MPGLQGGDRQPGTGPFGQLTIERRVLIVPGSTIPIAGIGVVSTGAVGLVRKLPLTLALLLLAGGLALTAVGFHQRSALLLALGGGGLLGGLLLAAFFVKVEQHCLSIASASGQVFLFTGQRKTLEEARRLLTDKINAGDDSAVYRINFEKGIVHAAGHAELLAPALPGLPPAGPGRIGGFELPVQVASAPVPQLTNGHYASPAAHIDYAAVLPQIVDMQRFYAQRPDTQEIAERLNEMEYLMRSGTPTAAGRDRLGQLAGELSAILGAYPSVVQIFQQAARLAGV